MSEEKENPTWTALKHQFGMLYLWGDNLTGEAREIVMSEIRRLMTELDQANVFQPTSDSSLESPSGAPMEMSEEEIQKLIEHTLESFVEDIYWTSKGIPDYRIDEAAERLASEMKPHLALKVTPESESPKRLTSEEHSRSPDPDAYMAPSEYRPLQKRIAELEVKLAETEYVNPSLVNAVNIGDKSLNEMELVSVISSSELKAFKDEISHLTNVLKACEDIKAFKQERIAELEKEERAMIARLHMQSRIMAELERERDELKAQQAEALKRWSDIIDERDELKTKLDDTTSLLLSREAWIERSERANENLKDHVAELEMQATHWHMAAQAEVSKRKRSHERIAELEAALNKLVTKIDEVHRSPEYETVWYLNHLCHGPYEGPKYDEELNHARAALGMKEGEGE